MGRPASQGLSSPILQLASAPTSAELPISIIFQAKFANLIARTQSGRTGFTG